MNVLLLTLVLASIIVLVYLSVRQILQTHFFSVQGAAEMGRSVAKTPVQAGVVGHLGDTDDASAAVPDEQTKGFAVKYGISFADRVYVDQVVSLQVHLAAENIALTVKGGERVVSGGLLIFTHRWYEDEEPLPKIQVDLKFAEGDFQASNKSQTKALEQDTETVFSFLLKPLRSTDLLLGVEIAYLGVKWEPETVTKITVTKDGYSEKTTVTKTPGDLAPDRQVLVSEDLIIQVKSFLNMNAAALQAASKIVAAILTVVYVGIVIYSGLTDSVLDSVIVGITGLVGIFGIPIADVYTQAQIKREEAANDGVSK